MYGFTQTTFRCVTLVATVFAVTTGFAEELSDGIDPFVDNSEAKKLMTGFGEFNFDRTKEVKVSQDQAQNPFLVSPLKVTEKKPDKNVNQRVSGPFRLDLRSQDKFRVEMAISNHADKSCTYFYGEGTWSLRGRLLVLTYILHDNVDRMAFFIEKISESKFVVKGIDDSFAFNEDGKGALEKTEKPKPLSIPKGFSLEIDEDNFGPVQQDVAKYYRTQMNAKIELTNEK
ncbi:MAG: hypothetical protein CMJ78_08715 [Planctomycetaceae bacterium]|nr:hypothetical protein [Planctomycetaceae bacterium]